MANSSLILKNTFFLYIRSFVVLIVTLYTSRVVLNALGVNDFGVFNAVGGVIGTLTFLNDSLLSTYQRYFNMIMGSDESAGLHKWFRAAICTQILLVLIVVLIAETLGLWFMNAKMIIPEDRLFAANVVYQVSIFIVILTILQAPHYAMITAKERMNIFAIISIVDAFLKLGISFILTTINIDRLIVYSVLLTLVSITDYLCYTFYVERKFDLGKFYLNWDKTKIKSLATFTGYGIIDSLSQSLKYTGIGVLINVFFGPIVNAANGVANQVISATNQFVTNFQTAFRPQLTKSYAEKNYDYMYSLFYSSSKLSFYLMLIVSVPIIIEIPMILNIWLGEAVPKHTDSFVRLSLLIAWVSCFANPTSCIIYATGVLKKFTIWVGGLNLAIIPVAYACLKLGGNPESVFVASLSITIIVQIARLIIFKEILSCSLLNYSLKVLLPALLTGLLSFVVPLILTCFLEPGIIRTLIVCVVSLFWTCFIIWIIGCNTYEKAFVRKKINQLLRKR